MSATAPSKPQTNEYAEYYERYVSLVPEGDIVETLSRQGGETLALLRSIPEERAGYANYDYYPTPGNSGDPAKCRQLLAQAGYPHGFKIIDVYRSDGNGPAVFTSVQSDLKTCGITSVGSAQEQGPYYAVVQNGPNSAKANQWDITEAGWAPDWLGNNGRSTVVPLFQANCTNPTTNEGCYSSKTTDSLIKQALAADITDEEAQP